MNVEKLADYAYYFSPRGRLDLLELIRELRAEYGETWIAEFKREFPDLAFVIDLVANQPASAAVESLNVYLWQLIESAPVSFLAKLTYKTVLTATLEAERENIVQTHELLRNEIDKPRF